MKISTVASIAGVVIVVGVVVMVAFRSPAEAPAPSISPEFQDISVPASGNGQFIQLEPSTTPPPATETEESASQPTISPAAASTDEAVTISIDETGFTPSTVTIAAGTTVTFVNNGQAQHWPASDNHPTHTVYPEFDAKRGLETGETYSFTFTKVGTWSMHDHLAPGSTGTITVQ